MLNRLPILPASTDAGFVYVVKRGEAYKIGFSRRNVRRRAQYAGGVVVLTIPTGQRPGVLERKLHHRFEDKRLPPQGARDGDRREWFSLDDADLDWLRGLGEHLSEPQDIAVPESEVKPLPLVVDG